MPKEFAATMTEAALDLPDTDWHVDALYDFLYGTGASVIVATHSRCVIDLNRPSDGTSLYPGLDVTDLCPTTTFDNNPFNSPARHLTVAKSPTGSKAIGAPITSG